MNPSVHTVTSVVSEKNSVVGRLSAKKFQQVAREKGDLSVSMLSYLAKRIPVAESERLGEPELQEKVRMVVFDAREYDRDFFRRNEEQYNQANVQIEFVSARLSEATVGLAEGAKMVSVFVNDMVNAQVVRGLKKSGVEHIALRCAGFNQVDLAACDAEGVTVTRVPAYSPNSVAEHTVALLLSLSRKTHIAYSRTRCGDFSLTRRLLGFDLCERTVGVVGTGKIGKLVVRTLRGFGSRVLCYDVYRDPEVEQMGGEYVSTVNELLSQSDVVTLHSPLLPQTHHMINDESIKLMRKGAILINTSRGALIDTPALIRALKSRHIAAAGIDVYEDERDYFFSDWKDSVITDDILARLITFPNVIVTSHQAFFTDEALSAISDTVLANVNEFVQGKRTTELTNTLNKL
jgi:D-lactate dehydrogenase